MSWSNVAAGWEYGITGVLLGLATPASLIISESILSRAIMRSEMTSKIDVENRDNIGNTRDTVNVESVETPFALDNVESLPHTLPKRNTVQTPIVEMKEIQKEEIPEKVPTKKLNKEKLKKMEVSQNQVVESEAEQKSNVEKIAQKIMKETGRLPGRRKLMERAGCSEWEARQIVSALKQQIV